ncbi:uncharacterized protein LOC113520270 [Galleria mellonella]|uniref:Uncharacterized protein LOC113520270 n=1 Tax=Galleria mellonella TaxID=7137 RepID=A0A6J1WY90_GALME|nr:uncharacterized protein LOC113520270 [Galleria mellonella]
MAVNKENKYGNEKTTTTSRIPLPIHPLPALPKHLMENKMQPKKLIMNERHPLKTLNNQSLSVAGPSKLRQTKKTVLKIDSRHVTLRQGKEELDWEFKVFKDELQNDSVISGSEDESINDEEYKKFVGTRRKNSLGEPRTAVTPALTSLEPSKVRNIKRSLKRPHSRELQGLSPAKGQEKGEDKFRRQLSFNEPLEERLLSPDFLKQSYTNSLNRDYATDMFVYLIEVEERSPLPRISSVMRACVVNWLMKVHGPDGNPTTIQSACWYLDSVLSTGQVEVHKLQLLAAACYWIAQKLNGPVLSASRLVRFSNNAFSSYDLMMAEKQILERLKFPRQPVVAQEYISYLSWWCDSTHPGKIEVGATFLCMCGLLVDKNLCNECPSVVGVAAVKNALYLLKKPALILRLKMCPVYKAAEKKATNLSSTCSVLRRAARALASPMNEYKAPLEQYGVPPHYIAQKIIKAANELCASTEKVYK